MKILGLVTDAFGGYGGIAQYNRDFLGALACLPQITKVHVLPRITPELVVVPPQITQHTAVFNPWLYSLNAFKHCVQLRPDLIFNGHIYHGPLAARLADRFGTKLISQLHGTEVWEPLATRHLRPLRNSDIVLCVSGDTRERYLGQSQLPTENAAVLPNTVDPKFNVGDRAAARRAIGLTDEFAILTVSRLDGRGGYKGHDRVLKALPRLTARSRKIVYLIAGVGEDQRRLETLARECGVEHQTRFLGKITTDNLPALYRAADLFALPSTGEGFGIVFLEAMACGTPAIGLAVGGAPDALGDVYGRAVKPEVFEPELQILIEEVIDFSPKDRFALSSRTANKFGRPAFAHRVEEILLQNQILPSPSLTPQLF